MEKASADVAESRAALAGVEASIRAQRAESVAQQAQLEATVGELLAEIASRRGAAASLAQRLHRTQLRAPVDAAVGAMTALGKGTTVPETEWGAHIGTGCRL